MFCPNCGKKIADNSRFCEFCGAAVLLPEMGRAAFDAEAEYDERSETGTQDANYPGEESENAWAKTGGVNPYMPESEPAESDAAAVSDNGGNDAKNRKRRMIIILIVIAAAAAVVVIAFAMFKFSEKKQQEEWQDQYDLGERALLDEDYDQAVVNFTEAIEIDPEEPDAYIGRGDAYAGQGKTDEALADYEQARDILEEDLKENPDDEETADKMDDIDDKIGYIDDLIKEKETFNRYQAYYDKLMELQEMYGKAALKSVVNKNTNEISTYYWTGMFFAELLDFDGDGEEELITAVYDPDENSDFYENWGYDYDGYLISVWAYEDGEVQEVYQQDEMYAFSSGADDSGCLIVEREEIWYMVTGYVSGDADLDDCYYSYDAENMTFSIEKRFELDWIDDYYSFRIDGEDAEEEEFYEEISIWNEELSEELKYYFLWDEWVDDEWVDETVGDVSEELAETFETLMSFLGIEAEDEDLITDSEALYQAYYDKLMELQETYGVSVGNSDLSDGFGDLWLEGLCFAELLDLNSDGEEELILAYYDPDRSDETVTYEGESVGTGGYIIEVWANQDGILTQVYSGFPVVRAGEYIYCAIVEMDGTIYLVSGTQGNGDGGIFELYQYTGEETTLSKTVIAWSSGYSIDGTEVSAEEAYEAADEIIMAATEYGLCTFLYGEDPDDVALADDTLNDTLAYLLEY